MKLRLLLLIGILLFVSCSDDGDDLVDVFFQVNITGQPNNQTAYSGDSVVFSVSVEGTEPISYQWYVNGVFETGNPQLVMVANEENSKKQVHVKVTNSRGNQSSEAVSNVVKLSVIQDPEITTDIYGMRKIPADSATFTMGSTSPRASSDESPIRNVAFSKSYWMDSIPVNRKEFWDLMVSTYPYTHDSIPADISATMPVTEVSWYDAILFSNARSVKNSLEPFYRYKTNLILDTVDYAVLQLEDSLLIRRIGGQTVTTKVEILDTIAIIPPEKNTVTVVAQGISGFPEFTVEYQKAETLTVIPNEGYFLTNVDFATSHTVIEDTSYQKVISYSVDTVKVDSASNPVGSKVGVGLDSVIVTEEDFQNGFALLENENYDRDTVFSFTLKEIEDDVENLNDGDTIIVFFQGIDRTPDTVIYHPDTVIVDSSVALIDSVVADSVLPTEGFRLPTEAEWEFAVRQYTGTDFYFPRDSIDLYAWYSENSNGSAQPSGQMNPNRYGLYDMSGNVWEWCFDYYSAKQDSVTIDPTGPEDGTYRVRRGGSYRDSEIYLRSTQRGSGKMGEKSDRVGFRTVRTEF